LKSNQKKLFEINNKSQNKSTEERPQKSDKERGCVFCEIVKSTRSGRQIVFEDSLSLAFLDKRPVFLGHCLVIPKNHYETLYDLPNDLIAPIFSNVQLVARAVEAGTGAQGTFIGINNKISQSVPHLHIHIVPRRFRDGLRGFFWPRQKYESDEQLAKIADSIRKSIKEIVHTRTNS
jgi:histidine triad (HIT) family protein